MADVEPVDKESGWHMVAIEFLKNYMKDKDTFKVIVSEFTDRTNVALFECFPEMDFCINAALVESDLAVSTGKLYVTFQYQKYVYIQYGFVVLFSSRTVKWHKQDKQRKQTETFTLDLLKTIQSTGKQLENDKEEEEVDENDDYNNVIKKEIIVLRADNPDLIYVQFKDDFVKKHFLEMDSNLQEFYSKNKPQSDKLEVGNSCVVHRRNTDNFNRATVLEITDDKAMVQLCDRSETIEVQKEDLYDLDDKFKIYPNFAFKCHLDDISPAGDSKKWSFLAVEYLQEIFKNQHKILMTKSSMDTERNSWPVIMWYVEFVCSGPLEPTKKVLHCINKELISNGLALKKRTLHKKSNIVPQHRIPTRIQAQENPPMETLQTLTDYIAAPPVTKKKFVAIVTYVDEDGVIHLQDYDMQEPFEEMVMQMNKYFKNTQPETTDFHAGDLCTVLYRDNEYWYRGKVNKCEADGTYKVHVIDYGNEEKCTHDELRKTAMYLDLPSFSHKVRLNNVFPKDGQWITSDIDVLQTIFNNQKVVVIVKKQPKDNGPPFVDIFTEDGMNANEFIVKQSTNLSNKPFKRQTTNHARVASDDENVIIDDIVEETVCTAQSEKLIPLCLCYAFAELPPIGTKLDVGIVNVLDYNDLIIEINNNLESEVFVTLSANMQAEGEKQPHLSVIKVGQPCIAKYSEDQLWYRAQIMEILTSEVVKVWFVDFGNFEDVKIAELKEVKLEWFSYPLQHYRAKICNVKLRDETRVAEVINILSDLCGSLQTVKIVERDPLIIEIYKADSEEEELLYWDLIEKGILAL